MQIKLFDFHSDSITTVDISVNKEIDTCPVCRNGIKPILHPGYYDDKLIQVISRCPRAECKSLFVTIYQDAGYHNQRVFLIVKTFPIRKIQKEFDQIIKDISESFCVIYNQAFQAEQDGLLEICGVGYRKTLEFLVKDYLIKLAPDREEEIKRKALGKCISDDTTSENIREIARRATWLGNDETHYIRKWENKDLQDLKRLIEITVFWIEMEQKTKEAIQDMPYS